ncbi:MAG: hypothetical protein KF901_10825, partial [Myxococcales bacterium]|nr:hypothetical protein [Myxococcales bacterium]
RPNQLPFQGSRSNDLNHLDAMTLADWRRIRRQSLAAARWGSATTPSLRGYARCHPLRHEHRLSDITPNPRRVLFAPTLDDVSI